MHVSFGELNRIAPEAIRMLGYPYGHADDCVEGIVWTQSVLGRGYELLRMADRRRPAAGWPAPSIADDDQRSVVHLAGAPVFSLAARLADLAHSSLSDSPHAPAVVTVTGGFGGWIAPYIGARLARAGLHAAVTWDAGRSADTSDGAGADTPPLTIVVPASADGTVRRLFIGPAGVVEADPGEEPLTVPIALVALARERAVREMGAGDDATSRLVAVALGPPPDERVVPVAEALTEATAVDVAARLARAMDEGLEVAREDHAVLTGLSQRIRLPNSERSRNQAG